jgi:hypothetical protein
MDSDNILSILASLGQTAQNQGIVPTTYRPIPAPGDAPINNVLQAAMAPPQVPTAPPAPPPQPVVAQPAAQQAPAHPKKRLSVIDIIGRLADTVATVGGSQPMYQPTLEHIQDRANQVDMDELKKRLTVAQVGEAELDPVLAARKRMGTALGALAGNANAAELWPSVAQQAGITDPQQVAQVASILQKTPDAAGIFAKALGADIDNLGKNVFFGTDTSGKTVAYQVGPDGKPHILDFGAAGVTPSDPIKVVNTGGSNVIVGSGGGVKRILPNTARPDTILSTNTQRDIAAGHDRTQLTIAGMPARGKGAAAGGDNSAFIQTAQGNLDELEGIYKSLNAAGAIVSNKRSAGDNITARARNSGVGQLVEGALGTKAQTARDRIASIRPGLMQSIAKATGMTGKQLDSNADVKLFMATVTDPTKSYEANIEAINGLRRFLRNNIKKPTAPPVVRPATRPAGNSGWGKATVVGG